MATASKVVLASGNAGKLREFNAMFAALGIDVVAQSEFAVQDAPETGLTFVENAIIKARNAAEHTGLPALADDSGIEVDALNGKPGIYSARFAKMNNAGEGSEANNHYLLETLQHTPESQRSARFRCCIVYLRNAHDPSPIIADASWEGRILNEATGTQGFGYDPLFFVPSHQMSAAELDSEEKNKISHRAQALQKLMALIKMESIKLEKA